MWSWMCVYVSLCLFCIIKNCNSGVVLFSLQVRITDWVYRQLCHCTTPIHPITAPLIEAFIQSVIVPASRSDSINDPISEQELSTVFSDLCVPSEDENGSRRVSFTTQLLLIYYVLLYEDTLLSNMSSIGKFLPFFSELYLCCYVLICTCFSSAGFFWRCSHHSSVKFLNSFFCCWNYLN